MLNIPQKKSIITKLIKDLQETLEDSDVFLNKSTGSMNYNYINLLNEVLNNESFRFWSGSAMKFHHHYGDYGLAAHTLEVLGYTGELIQQRNYNGNSTFTDDKTLKYSNIVFACIYHDFGKTKDYDKINGVWQAVDHKSKIHHISASAHFWQTQATKHGYPQEDIDEVTHAILAHHGRKEWGSPVEPQTRLAWLLHTCDNLSARMNDCYYSKRE